jgi:predicted RNA binding protein YcfA (HicA-like mRNA interferase family)
MLKQITFKQLENVLHYLGFEETKVKNSHVKFQNITANVLLALPIGLRTVKLPHLRMVERVLEETGMLTREEFETLVERFQTQTIQTQESKA